jgi:uncharacterized membrane protein
MLTAHLFQAAQDFLAAPPTPTPTPTGPTGGGSLNTDGIRTFAATQVVPILLLILGIVFLGRAQRGEVSRVLTSSVVAVVGLVFIAGAPILWFFGDSISKVIFH